MLTSRLMGQTDNSKKRGCLNDGLTLLLMSPKSSEWTNKCLVPIQDELNAPSRIVNLILNWYLRSIKVIFMRYAERDNEWQSERQTITEASKFLRQHSPNNTHLNLKRYFVLLWLSRQLCLPQKKEQGDTGAIVLFSSVWWDAWRIDGIMKTASMNDSRPHPIFHFIEMLRLH